MPFHFCPAEAALLAYLTSYLVTYASTVWYCGRRGCRG